MEEQVNQVIEWIKKQPINGCISGSCLLEYFPGSDVDVFVYDNKSLNKLLFAMKYDPMFLVIDPLEQWKLDKYLNTEDSFFKGILTIKFKYNTCIDVNVILKKNFDSIFAVLSSFDMSIVCKGIDIKTGKELDLTDGDNITKVANWNRWNNSFYDPELWEINKLLRQIDRVIKYHKRGYNTDRLMLKYIELCDKVLELDDIFHSNNYTERLELNKKNVIIVKQICEMWLETHEISDETLEKLKTKIKEF